MISITDLASCFSDTGRGQPALQAQGAKLPAARGCTFGRWLNWLRSLTRPSLHGEGKMLSLSTEGSVMRINKACEDAM